MLVYEGKVADVLTDEGIFNLKTANEPFFTNLIKLRQGFESEHKLCIYFFRKTQIVNQQWGTATPVKFIDSQYRLPVEMGAYGTFSYRISDVSFFFKNIVGPQPVVGSESVRDLLLDRLSQNIVSVLHGLGYAYTEIDGHLAEIGEALTTQFNGEYEKLGFTLTDFRINGTQFDEQTQARIGRIADVSADAQQVDSPIPSSKNCVPCAMLHVMKAGWQAAVCKWV